MISKYINPRQLKKFQPLREKGLLARVPVYRVGHLLGNRSPYLVL
jgi:hypothetical protein